MLTKTLFKSTKGIAGGFVLMLVGHALLAQDAEPVEEVVVTGIRSSLESALDVKRNADSIVDHISSEDIGSLPALDLGEALQAIPGIQLNAESTQRTSDINLRGLSGGFVMTTANGLGIATPSLSTSEKGASNPFGAFESSIFRGITVIKTPTADLPSGAIAGYIDKQLPSALSANRDRYEIQLGNRYEQLNDSNDMELSFRGRKELIEDVLAISGTYASSEQNFRRDTINITRYADVTGGANFFLGENGQTLDEYKAEWGLPEDANILYTGEVRHFSELANGDRDSYAVNLEWQATDKLFVGLDLLGSEKDLHDANSDIFILAPRQRNGTTAASRITPTAGVEPIYAFTNDPLFDGDGNVIAQGSDNYLITDYTYENGQYYPGNRLTDRLEQTGGQYLTAEWAEDRWALSVGAVRSDAEAESYHTQFDARYRPADRRRGGGRSPDDTNGIMGRMITGTGNIDNYFLDVNGFENLSLDGNFVYALRRADNRPYEELDRLLTQLSASWRGTNPDGTKHNTSMLVTGNEVFVDRDYDELKFDFEYDLDVSIWNSVKVGAYTSKEEFARLQNRDSSAYMNLDGIGNDLLIPAVYTRGNEFFNGNAPGAASADDGWVSIDVKAARAALTQGIEERYNDAYQRLLDDPTVEEGNTASDALTQAEKDQAIAFFADPEFTSGGFLRRRGRGEEVNSYTSSIEIKSAYLMANFSGDIGRMAFRGNAGLRYAETINSGRGLALVPKENETATQRNRLWDDEYQLSTPSNTYNHLLPSINFSLDVMEDVVVRAAYYEGIVRPNVASFRPNGYTSGGDRTVRIQVADSELLPFEADSWDLSVNWYNRQGSVISVGYFQKDVRDQSDFERICPTDGGGFGFGTLSLTGTAADPICASDDLSTVSSGLLDDPTTPQDESVEEIYREFIITQRVNSNAEQTVRGYEMALQQNLDILPAPWSNFGGIVNFSRVTNDGERIPGVSETSYNLVGYYETDKFNIRLAYNYRSDYLLVSTGTFNGTADRDVKGRGRLDLSATYRPTNGLRLTFRSYNLLDEIYQEFQARNQELGRRTNYDGRIFSVSANYVLGSR